MPGFAIYSKTILTIVQTGSTPYREKPCHEKAKRPFSLLCRLT